MDESAGGLYLVTSNKCSTVADMGDHLATTDMGQKWRGLCPFFGGELGPYLTKCRLGRGLRPYQVASSSIQPFGHNGHGPKIGSLCPLFWGAVSPSNIVTGDEAYLHAKFHLDPTVWPQYTNVTDRQRDRQSNCPIA